MMLGGGRNRMMVPTDGARWGGSLIVQSRPLDGRFSVNQEKSSAAFLAADEKTAAKRFK